MRVVSLLTACVAMSACMTDADVEPEVSTPSPTPVGHSPRVRPQYMDVYDAPPSPQITGFSPTHGGITGGTLVQIIGTAFDPNANADGSTQVTFDGMPAAGLYCESDTSCEALTPARPFPGTVSIGMVRTGYRPAYTYGFTYTALPSLASLTWSRSQGAIVSLDSYAPTGGASVVVVSSNASFVTPRMSPVNVPPGATSASIPLNFVTSTGTATLTATYAGGSLSTTITRSCPVSPCALHYTFDYDLCKCVRDTCSPGTCM